MTSQNQFSPQEALVTLEGLQKEPELISQLSFEEALALLEALVTRLERGDVPLEQSIELYQQGDRLRAHCEARLRKAQSQIEQISLNSNGEPIAKEGFNVE